MKHLKRFNEQNENSSKFFKDRIDWEFFRMLQSYVTKYEDKELQIDINVLVKDSISQTYRTVYNYNNSNETYFDTYLGDVDLVECYNENGLFYEVDIKDEENDEWHDIDSLDDLYKRISNKCDKVEESDNDDDDFGLLLKPKT